MARSVSFESTALVYYEVALIAYILTDPDDRFYDYISVFKLYCKGCYAFV